MPVIAIERKQRKDKRKSERGREEEKMGVTSCGELTFMQWVAEIQSPPCLRYVESPVRILSGLLVEMSCHIATAH